MKYRGNVNTVGLNACYVEGNSLTQSLYLDSQRHRQKNLKTEKTINAYYLRIKVNDGEVVSNSIVEAKQNKSLIVYHNSLQDRLFLYSNDLLEDLITLLTLRISIDILLDLGYIG